MNKYALSLGVLMLASSVASAEFMNPSNRTYKYEAAFIVNQASSWDTSGRNGGSIDVEDDTGYGFALGYNFSEHFNFQFEYIHNSQDYSATVIPIENGTPEQPYNINHVLTNDTFNFNFTYNFLASTFTPFVSGGIGWSYLDSNVADGEVDTICWWDPWWGYICDNYFDTYEDTAFSYIGGAGLRWELNRNFVIKATYNIKWMDIDAVGATPDMNNGKFEFTWMM